MIVGERLSKKEIEEVYRARLDSEISRPSTLEQKKLSEERIKEAREFARKRREKRGLDY